MHHSCFDCLQNVLYMIVSVNNSENHCSALTVIGEQHENTNNIETTEWTVIGAPPSASQVCPYGGEGARVQPLNKTLRLPLGVHLSLPSSPSLLWIHKPVFFFLERGQCNGRTYIHTYNQLPVTCRHLPKQRLTLWVV